MKYVMKNMFLLIHINSHYYINDVFIPQKGYQVEGRGSFEKIYPFM